MSTATIRRFEGDAVRASAARDRGMVTAWPNVVWGGVSGSGVVEELTSERYYPAVLALDKPNFNVSMSRINSSTSYSMFAKRWLDDLPLGAVREDCSGLDGRSWFKKKCGILIKLQRGREATEFIKFVNPCALPLSTKCPRQLILMGKLI